MDTTIDELDKFEGVSSVIKIEPVLYIDRDKMGTLGIITRIKDSVYVCICSVYSNILKECTQHAFVYDSYFTTTGNNARQGSIIDNRRYAPIYVLEEKDRTTIKKLKIMLRNFFEGTCSVKYAFKINSRDS